ncbi:hypothetical protein ACSSS7_004285 [Eimeria intestinalis]
MQPPDMHPAFERFHSPLELPDSWPDSELAPNGGSTHCSTAANPCPSDVAEAPLQLRDATQQEQTSLHQQMKPIKEAQSNNAVTDAGAPSCEDEGAFAQAEPSKMLLWLLAIGGAFCITLSCVAAVASLITASKLAETPVLFLQRKSPHLQGWEAPVGPPLKQQAGDQQSSSVWLDDADSSTIASTEISEKKQPASFPGIFSFDGATTGRGRADTEATFIFPGSPPKRVGIGSLRDVALEEIAASAAILLKPRPEEERLFRVEEAARNVESRETLLSLSQGYALVLKQVLAAWQLPFPSTPGGAAVALSPQQLQEKLQAAALHAADHSQPSESAKAGVDPQREDGIPSGLEVRGTGEEGSESRPPPHSELDYELLDAGEPLLSGYVVLPETPETRSRKVTRAAKNEGRSRSTSLQGRGSSNAAVAA